MKAVKMKTHVIAKKSCMSQKCTNKSMRKSLKKGVFKNPQLIISGKESILKNCIEIFDKICWFPVHTCFDLLRKFT